MPKLVVKRLEKLQRDFLWGGGSLERKIHLINWAVVCTHKESGGLGIRKIDFLNKALLGKWIWRFAIEEDFFWRKVVGVKYGRLGFGWRTKEARGTPKNASVNEMWDSSLGQGGWNIRLSRNLNDWELDALGELLQLLRDLRTSLEEDAVIWKGESHGLFRIKDAYKLLAGSNVISFPKKGIWVDKVPTKVAFFAWEASWEKVLTLDMLQRRGWQFPNSQKGGVFKLTGHFFFVIVGESLTMLHSELKHQRKLVRSLKKKSLWSRNLEEIVEKLVDVATFIHQEILEAFRSNGMTSAS
ncbi:putative ribonuclease H protein [Vitis vinifera]|nr:putative ribonuclease H protein [Vitis vinifera]